jgi:hypothetical protein
VVWLSIEQGEEMGEERAGGERGMPSTSTSATATEDHFVKADII